MFGSFFEDKNTQSNAVSSGSVHDDVHLARCPGRTLLKRAVGYGRLTGMSMVFFV